MWPIAAAALIGTCIGFLGGLTLAFLLLFPKDRPHRAEQEPTVGYSESTRPHLRILP